MTVSTMPPTPAASVIKETPFDERPRERLHEHGSAILSDAELVALLLRTGTPVRGVMEIARAVVRENGGLLGLLDARKEDLVREGLGEAKAASILAAVEIGRRLARKDVPDRHPLTRPEAMASYLSLRYRIRDQEVMGAVYLDARKRLVAEKEIFRGTLCRAAVEPRVILKEGLLQGASSVVLFHTHPSGDPTPSLEDLAFTRRMAEAGEAVGISLADHLILGSTGRWVSLRERGAW